MVTARESCSPSSRCGDCAYCDWKEVQGAGYEDPFNPAGDGSAYYAGESPKPLYGDVAAFLAGTLPPPPTPSVLGRTDEHSLFYDGKVNVLYGDPESGKTWIALAAVAEALKAGKMAAVVDLDHNGLAETVTRLLALGAPAEALKALAAFSYAEPDDAEGLLAVVEDLSYADPPDVVVVDSIGELLPMLGASSNSPDDYTSAHRRTLARLANAGACVIAIDHSPKDEAAREFGATGTAAKRRAINGVSYEVRCVEPFAPGRGGSSVLRVNKDRPGGVRAFCVEDGGRNPRAGVFTMRPGGRLQVGETTNTTDRLAWRIEPPHPYHEASQASIDADVAEVDALVPAPTSMEHVKKAMHWGTRRSQQAWVIWRDLRK